MEKLQIWRRKQKITQMELAEYIGVYYKTLSKWELEYNVPPPKVCDLIDLLLTFQTLKEARENIPLCEEDDCYYFSLGEGKCYAHMYPTQKDKTNLGKKYKTVNSYKKSPEVDKKTLSDRLKTLRIENGHSIEVIAHEFGVTADTVKAWEAGTVTPSYIMLIDMGGFYNVQTRYLEHGKCRFAGVKNREEV